MSVAILASPRPAGVRFVVSALAELGAALHRATSVDHAASPWSRRTWSRMPEALRAECRLFSPLWGGYRSRLLLPLGPTPADLASQLTGLAEVPLHTVVEWASRALVGSDRLPPGPVDPAWLRRRAAGRGGEAAADLLLADPGRFRDRLVAALEGCGDAFFLAEWRSLAPRLSVEAARADHLAGRGGPLPTLARLVPGSRVADAPERLVVDKLHHAVINLARTELVAVPTVLGAPHVLIKHEPEAAAVVQYPVRVRAGERNPVPLPVLTGRLRVLADPTRLRVCRLIARHPRSTREMAETLGMSPPEMSRHLRALREAGMVVTERRGRFVLYTLRHDEVASLGADMLEVLLR
jgi:DNA-binding transcriptional ArsR family regulator